MAERATKKAKTTNGASDKERVVLAYSGGLDTSVILCWLIEKVGRPGCIT
jgi:argininosuccinate synthase